MKKRNKILSIIPIIGIIFFWITTADTNDDFTNSIFYEKLNQLNIPLWNILLWNTLTRYDFTRLLNAIECQDCIVPQKTMKEKYNQAAWIKFQQIPGKYFWDIEYENWKYNWTNYYYCVANIGNDDIMNWYPLWASDCWWKFCWQRNVTKAEFFQTLSNFLMDRNMFKYSAPRWEIKSWFNNLNKNDPGYKYLNSKQIDIIKNKWNNTEQITNRDEYTTYLAFCTFNTSSCWFKTFNELKNGQRPVAESNILIQDWIIEEEDVTSLNTPITPRDAMEKMRITYERHIRCEFNNDYDCDNIPNYSDNCPYDYNPTQNDFDGDWIWDVCDADIDWDWILNPAWFVDDNWNIDYWLLKKYSSDDSTPFWEQVEDSAYFIQVNSISQQSPTNVQFSIAWPDTPTSVEWDFWDLGKGKWKTITHNYNWQWVYTISAKVTTKQNRKHLLSTQIYLGQIADSSYSLNIDTVTIDNKKNEAIIKAVSQWKYDYYERRNSATNEIKQSKTLTNFTTKLVPWKRNNITLKGIVNDQLAAWASTDIRDDNWKFYTFTPTYAPTLKTIDWNITASLKLVNIPFDSIEDIYRDFWDDTIFSDTKITNNNKYIKQGQYTLQHRIHLEDGTYLRATSTITIQDPTIIWNQTYNILPTFSNGNAKLIFNNKWLIIKEWDKLVSTINNQQEITVDTPDENIAFLELGNKQWVVKIKTKLQHWNLTLENNGIITFWIKDETDYNITNIDKILAWLKCDLDKDWIPDIYDSDVDWDWVPNLLGLVTKEREDCKFIIGENVDETLYNKHFWICSLDNCPFRANSNQADLNVNWIWDICEWIWECWNWIIDIWEDCKTCSDDVWPCTAFCWNWRAEKAENCKNCPQDIAVCPSKCWNGEPDPWETCDHWTNNGTDWECTIACTEFDYNKPNCGNWVYDEWENCITCPIDISDICIDDWLISCWNDRIDEWETCINCPQDVWNCTSVCWNWIVEAAEDCSSCPKDVWICTSSCGNGIKEPWEQCDNWKYNWLDWKCSEYCRVLDSTHKCWDKTKDEYEECDEWSSNWKISSQCTIMCTKYNPIKPNCGNWVADPGETCLTCPVDLWEKCSKKCWNGIKEIWEECDNWTNNWYDWQCSFECKKTNIICWNNQKDSWEDCDNGSDNWTKNSKDNCSVKCTTNISKEPECWNWVREWNEQCDLWKNQNWKGNYYCSKDCKERSTCENHWYNIGEKCDNCSEDLGAICIDNWGTCWNNIIEPWETCKDCPQDVWSCTSYCWNWTIEAAENCNNCPKDVWNCTSSCGNGIKEPWEECDHWALNWWDWKCSELCRRVDPNHRCWDWTPDEEEKCDLWGSNWKQGSPCTINCTDFNPLTPNCGNWVIDQWETCLTCPVDLWIICSRTCWNWIKEGPEECDNGINNWYDWECSFECKKTKTVCWNNKTEWDEKCDDWTNNWTPNSEHNCSEKCTKIISTTPNCGNGIKEWKEECDLWSHLNWTKDSICSKDCKEIKSCPNNKYDKNETCETCPADLWDICLTDWTKPAVCWNGIIEEWENCRNCNEDVKDCTSFCWDWVVGSAENCSNCAKDLKECRWSCWNNEKEPWEQCDHGKNNWLDGKCSTYCTIVDSSHKCWDWHRDEYEQCDNWTGNWMPWNSCTKMCTDYIATMPNCGNWVADIGETCLTCPIDLWEKCYSTCWNGIQEIGEQCDNWINNWYDWKCSFECKETKAVCWNKILEDWETCDDWWDNWTTNSKNNCTIRCTINISNTPECWNGVKEWDEECDLWKNRNGMDWEICSAWCKEILSCPNHQYNIGETCDTCPEDLWEKCIDDWTKTWCWDWKADANENCKNCPKDVWECNAYCWNSEIEAAESCRNCSTDTGKCTWSCGNWIKEPWEQCDDWSNFNWHNWNCSESCTLVNPNQICWNKIPEWTEVCDDWTDNWTLWSNCTKICTTKDSLNPKCWDWVQDPRENCTNCPADLGIKCLHICWDWTTDYWEECDNWKENNGKDGICWFDCKKTKAKCWNKILEKWEECDNWTGNWIDNICSENCIKVTIPKCWNGNQEFWEECDDWPYNNTNNSICSKDCKKIKTCLDNEIEKGETCQTCAEDLWEKCIADTVCWNGIKEWNEECDDWRQNGTNNNCDKNCKKLNKCWNGTIDEGETCKTCPQDVWPCTAKCWNWIVEEAEDCSNCIEDVWNCTASCGDGNRELDAEQCDHGNLNGKDKQCTYNCKSIIDKTKPYCWDWNTNTELWEQCDAWDSNWKSACSYICTKVYRPTTCWNGIIDLWENCLTCPLDLADKCLKSCGDWEINFNEECDNWKENNGRDGKCTSTCKKVTASICWNGTREWEEECDNWTANNWNDNECSKRCTKYDPEHPKCWDWKVDPDEDCNNCPKDVWLCRWSCWNKKLELGEECDHGDQNGKDWLCDANCRDINPNKLCWNGFINTDNWEQCDDWTLNWENGQCSKNCKTVTRPNCGNWKIDWDENCNNCPEDLGIKCLWRCWDENIDEWEQCDNGENNNWKDGKCTSTCSDVNWCWNGEIDPWEDCTTCPKDLKDICIDHWDDCPNGKVDSNENCLSCPQDAGQCSWSCWNHEVEDWEDCDNWSENWKDWICSSDCKNVDSEHYCWNNKVETDRWEKCDLWTNNWIFEKWCRIDCQEFDPENPDCWNGKIDPGEDCKTCPTDLKDKCIAKCWDWIVSEKEECDPKANNWEGIECTNECKINTPECINWNCNTVCNRAIDRDCDWCPDSTDPCPYLAWSPNGQYKCCPDLPDTTCLNGDCPLVNPICNQCPCQYADYSNTLQKDDQVRARLRDQSFMVHYNYSPLVNISNFIN